jgi:hypothetical protein
MSDEAPIICRPQGDWCSVKGQPLTKKTWRIFKLEAMKKIYEQNGIKITPTQLYLSLEVGDIRDRSEEWFINLPDE